ncbi:unnamed protein product [Euphydryas editha]|uniref:DUF4817 domain-containing protein n=1 Tax=Euphydryas editha TaxID=104508 RepID=A0AAU9TRV3_EUPED|nr:unnamed protein product [Euphydryas editha]
MLAVNQYHGTSLYMLEVKKALYPNCLFIFSGKNKMEDYNSEMNVNNFTKWITEKLIPNLHEESITVFDNTPYHSVIINKTPNTSTRVDDIKLWLSENNIPFDSLLRKNRNLVSWSVSGAQRPFCVCEYYKNNDSATETKRKFCTHFNIRNAKQAPTIQTIKKWVQKFEKTGSTLSQPRSGRPRTSRNPEKIERVRASVREQPGMSTRKRSSVLNVPTFSSI